MKVWVNRDICGDNLATCEACFGQFLLSGQPDRMCITRYKEDDSEAITVIMQSEGHVETLVIPPERREEVAFEGWSRYVSFTPRFRKNEGREHI